MVFSERDWVVSLQVSEEDKYPLSASGLLVFIYSTDVPLFLPIVLALSSLLVLD